ncbi:MAG TPA: hypothetical protein VGN65_10845, partial [Casimicrobiaceae bacterium]
MIAGYEPIDELVQNDQFRICRARRRHDGAQVLVKMPTSVPPRAADIAALDREIAILRTLAIGGVLQPFEPHAHYGHALLLEDPNSESLRSLCGMGNLPLDHALSIAIQLTTVLEGLHARGIA